MKLGVVCLLGAGFLFGWLAAEGAFAVIESHWRERIEAAEARAAAAEEWAEVVEEEARMWVAEGAR